MKNLRLFQTAFLVLAVCVGFISCEKEEQKNENDGGTMVPTYIGKKLVKLDDCRLSYDDKGRLIKFDYKSQFTFCKVTKKWGLCKII